MFEEIKEMLIRYNLDPLYKQLDGLQKECKESEKTISDIIGIMEETKSIVDNLNKKMEKLKSKDSDNTLKKFIKIDKKLNNKVKQLKKIELQTNKLAGLCAGGGFMCEEADQFEILRDEAKDEVSRIKLNYASYDNIEIVKEYKILKNEIYSPVKKLNSLNQLLKSEQNNKSNLYQRVNDLESKINKKLSKISKTQEPEL